MIRTVRDFQELSPSDTLTHTADASLLAEDTCTSILTQVESQTIQVSLKALMSIAPSITDHIQRHLLRQPTSVTTTSVQDPINVDTVVAVDRHMPIISITIS